MWKRKPLWILATVAVALAAFVFWPEPDRITPADLKLIKQGMGRAEVEAILGTPFTEEQIFETYSWHGNDKFSVPVGTKCLWRHGDRMFRANFWPGGQYVMDTCWEPNPENYGWTSWLRTRLQRLFS